MTESTQRTPETKAQDVLDLLGRDHVRLVSLFGSLDDGGRRRVHYIVDVDNREYRVLECSAEGPIPSATAATPAAAWYERELADQFGVQIQGHPDLRPLLFHENWPDGVHPMLGNMSEVPVARRDYRFLKVQGEGVCEVPVGRCTPGSSNPATSASALSATRCFTWSYATSTPTKERKSCSREHPS